jgi:hypothetical protein
MAVVPTPAAAKTTGIPLRKSVATSEYVTSSDFQAENALLGRLLQDSQSQCDQTAKRLQAAKRRATEADKQKETLQIRLEQGDAT